LLPPPEKVKNKKVGEEDWRPRNLTLGEVSLGCIGVLGANSAAKLGANTLSKLKKKPGEIIPPGVANT